MANQSHVFEAVRRLNLPEGCRVQAVRPAPWSPEVWMEVSVGAHTLDYHVTEEDTVESLMGEIQRLVGEIEGDD